MEFLSVCTHLLKLHIDDASLGEHGQASPNLKTLRSPKQRDV